MYNTLDTIAAVATPPGESALAIVRLSGPKAREIIESIFRGARLENKKASYGRLYGAIGEQIDEVVVIFYQKPHGFTAEDMAEIICHGGYVIPNQIINILCNKGARLAEPGEFTLRAFLNGRIDLTEAEAIDTVIRAKSNKAKELALGNLEGKLQRRLIEAKERLFNLITMLEAEIDFGDDEITKTPRSSLIKQLRDVHVIMREMVGTYDTGKLAEGRVQVAIIGAPNVGKSTLFNAILKDNRAIVADSPGTTRDYLSEYVNIGGYPVILTDTAGVRDTDQEIESIGIEKTIEIISNSTLCLLVVDCSRKLNDDDWKLLDIVRNYKYLLVVNKSDQISRITANELEKFNSKFVKISSLSGDGIDTLLGTIKSSLLSGEDSTDFGVLLSQRQYECATKALSVINDSIEAIERNEPDEIVTGLLRESINHIGEILGKITSEDILGRIFSRFCIGK
jgi:tRNA modification GTPase